MATPLTKPAGDQQVPGLAVLPSSIQGHGLFTLVARRAGDQVAVIDGEVISGAEAERRDEGGNYYIYELDEDRDRYVDAAMTLGRFVNHACEASCEVESRDDDSLWLVANRDLAAGEELTIDYDYEEIFAACRSKNPSCLGERCPKRHEWGDVAR